MPTTSEPLAETERRHVRWEDAASVLLRRARRLSNGRLLAFACGLVFSLWIMKSHPQAWGWLAAPVALFTALVVAHGRAQRAAVRAAGSRDVYARSLLRQRGGWEGTGPRGPGQTDGQPPLYADDLDLFGDGSLFQLVATAGSPLGLGTLAAWFSRPARAEEVAARQAAVRELAAALDLREDLALLGAEAGSALDRQALVAWATAAPERPRSAVVPAVADGLGLLGGAALVGWAAGWLPFFPLGLVLIADLSLLGLCWRSIESIQRGLEATAPALAALSRLLVVLERTPLLAPRLRALQAAVATGGLLASARIGRLAAQLERLDASQRNPFFAPFALLFHVQLRTARALAAWRATHGPAVAGWLDAVGEFEALAALGGHAYEHPGHTFPVVHEGPPCFRARGLGHVLLPAGRCVRNDLLLDGDHRLVLLSGSNMSGKSTLLRAVGVNLLLAMAGAPVRAAALECTPLVLATSMRLVDSLRDGTSHFLAEARRLQAIDALTRAGRPVLYLLDEILHGTNSSDRLAGARAVIRRLFERGALGMVTTHDLALAAIADELAPRASNAHLREGFDGGRMTFDYTLREGVVAHGNALDLMRSLGLDV